LRSLIKREIRVRYRSAALGLAWLIINPLLLLATYTLVFGVIFTRKSGVGESLGDFILTLFCGLTLYWFFAETMNRSCSVIRSQPNLVKKVVFPVEILPLVSLGASVFSVCLNLLILVALSLLINLSVHPTILLAPLVILPLVVMTAGFAWVISGWGVYYSDLDNVVLFLTTLMLFLSPIFYPVSAAPEAVQPFFILNPLAFPIEELRKVVLLGESPDWSSWIIYMGVAAIIGALGFRIFQKGRELFADFL